MISSVVQYIIYTDYLLFSLQVVTGGHYDVDVVLKDPKGKVLYEQKKKQYDSYQFTAEAEGRLCLNFK